MTGGEEMTALPGWGEQQFLGNERRRGREREEEHVRKGGRVEGPTDERDAIWSERGGGEVEVGWTGGGCSIVKCQRGDLYPQSNGLPGPTLLRSAPYTQGELPNPHCPGSVAFVVYKSPPRPNDPPPTPQQHPIIPPLTHSPARGTHTR
ncbi:unnamed protein product [Boreogadus saida]